MKQIDALRGMMVGFNSGAMSGEGSGPVSLPLDPTKLVIGVKPEGCSVMRSALYPLLIEFILEGID